MTPRNCTRCGELLPADAFYFVSKKLGTRRGQCKPCMAEVKAAQRDPSWLPTCARCGELRPRSGPGRRLCAECFGAIYDEEDRRSNGAHRLRLNPCRLCNTPRLRADHVKNTALCPVCRSVSPSRRKSLALYGMTPRDYLALLTEQGDACAICRRPSRGDLHIDHRHRVPSIVRGAICNPCNTLIGLAREDTERLRRAIAYLDAPPAQIMFPGLVATEKANRTGESWNRLTRVTA
jgi:hypothetical protein